MADMDEIWEGGDLVCVDFDGTLTKGQGKLWEDEVVEPNGIRCEKGGAGLYVEDKAMRPKEVLQDD